MSQHTKEPWVVHLFEGGGFVINTSADVYESPVICARYDWSFRVRDNAIRIGQCVNACRGLTAEQIAAIPRLIEWCTVPTRIGSARDHERWVQEWRDLETLFPPRG